MAPELFRGRAGVSASDNTCTATAITHLLDYFSTGQGIYYNNLLLLLLLLVLVLVLVLVLLIMIMIMIMIMIIIMIKGDDD